MYQIGGSTRWFEFSADTDVVSEEDDDYQLSQMDPRDELPLARQRLWSYDLMGYTNLFIIIILLYEVSRFTRYKAVNGGAKYRKWGGLGWLGGTQGQYGNVTIR